MCIYCQRKNNREFYDIISFPILKTCDIYINIVFLTTTSKCRSPEAVKISFTNSIYQGFSEDSFDIYRGKNNISGVGKFKGIKKKTSMYKTIRYTVTLQIVDVSNI